MTEEDLQTEIIPKNKLQIMIKESDLPEDKSAILIGKFASFFVDVQVWEKKAKAIVVKDESQKVIMDQARQGRLFIRKIRLDIEKCRKELKEQSLREGKAIDKVSNFLKDALEPIESHLDRQEHFVEYREAEKEAIIQAEIEKRMEEERLAEEKRKAEELEVTRKENEKLKKEAEERERINREATEKIKKENEAILSVEREKVRKVEEELRLKRQTEMKAEADRIRSEELLKSASDSIKMQVLLDYLKAVKMPELVSQDAKRVAGDCQGYLNMATMKLDKYIKSTQVNEEDI